MDDEREPHGMSATLAENIRALARRRAEDEAAAPLTDRIARRVTDFTGSMRFVILHLAAFGGWIVVNLGVVPGLPQFDPSFVTLAMVASVEAIFLSTFVLIAQNRMACAADRRADLDLHINLLAEHELTKMGDLLTQIADRLGVDSSGEEVQEIRNNVEPETVLDAIDRSNGDAQP